MIPRIYTPQPLASDSVLKLEMSASRHLLQVLRLRPLESLYLFNGAGTEYAAQFVEHQHDAAWVRVEARIREEPIAAFAVHLLIGISKGERMDFALQKAVELGVTRLSPLFTERSVVRLAEERRVRRQAHWQQLIISACEQSGRCRLPLLDPPAALEPALIAVSAPLRLVLQPHAAHCLEQCPAPTHGLALLIGTEGGLSPTELALTQRHDFLPLRLGPRIMRSETAPLAALAAIQMLWGDFRMPSIE